MSSQVTVNRNRSERKKEETKQRIIVVAMKLFKSQGVDMTTMEQIAREVDVAKGTLYNYFPVKEAIIDEAIKRSFREQHTEKILALQKLPDTRSRMISTFGKLMEGVQAQKDIFEKYIYYRMRMMLSFQQEESEKSGFYLLAAEMIELGQKNGEIRIDLPFYTLLDQFEFAFMGVVKQFYLEPEKFSVSEAIERCVDLCLYGVRQGRDQ